MMNPGYLSIAVFSVLSAASAMADSSTVSVSLWDKGMDMPMVTNLTLASMKDLSMANMGVKLSTTKVKAGEVTFTVSNASKEIIHEMLVIRLDDGEQGPPIIEQEARIDEEGAHDLGEVSELDPGKAGSLTVDLTPGQYLLTCNIPGHYMNGMWSVLTVE